MYDINVSIVLYHNEIQQIRDVLKSLTSNELRINIYLIDNSANENLRECADKNNITYIYNNNNIGFGAAHNIAMRKSINESPYHLVLNPDVNFSPIILSQIFRYMEDNKKVGQLSVKTYYPDGSIQHLCKMLPTPFDLFARRFLPRPVSILFKKRMSRYELKHRNYDEIMSVPNLSGCFMFIRTKVLKEVGFFDENIFMYTEDVDLTRRIRIHSDTIYYPYVSIVHNFEKGSYKSAKLLYYHIKSAVYYFNKWGWLFDKERKAINAQL